MLLCAPLCPHPASSLGKDDFLLILTYQKFMGFIYLPSPPPPFYLLRALLLPVSFWFGLYPKISLGAVGFIGLLESLKRYKADDV